MKDNAIPENKTLLSSSNYSSIFQNWSEEARHTLHLDTHNLNVKVIDGAKNVTAKLRKILLPSSLIGESNFTLQISGTRADGTILQSISDILWIII